MKKFFFIGGLAGGTLLIAFFAIQPRPHPSASHSLAADSPAAVATDRTPDFLPAAANTNLIIESIPSAVTASTPIKPEESDRQKLVDAIRAALQSGDDAAWDRISQNELPQLIKIDPQAAADLAQSLEPGFIREQMLRQVAHGWTDQNSTTALTWASALTDADDRTSSLADVCIQISQTDPARAVAAATQYGLAGQPGLLENMMQQWAANDSAAALGWADQLPAGAERDQVMSSLAFVEAQVSPRDAINLVAYEIPPGPEQDEAIMSVLHQLALQDFASASTWANQFEAGPLQDRINQELAGIALYRQTLNN